ncbi:MAG: hypothetical protein K2X39_05785 [Silvanigrellaceae bacterium]|nr:hypothetical protein [Silvanigrellaceae bacterium]
MQENNQKSQSGEAFVPVSEIDGKKFTHVTSHHIYSGDLNATNSLFGGILVRWIDEAAATYVLALLRTHRIVTKKISEVIFNEPAHLGDVLDFILRVKSVGTTSITVECYVCSKPIDLSDEVKIIVQCELVFVKIDEFGKPTAHYYKN